MTMADVRVFALPDLGEGLTEAEIVRWRVSVGDTIDVDEVVVEVETAKAIVDVPCPYAGRVMALHGAPGDLRPVGQPLVTVAPPVTVAPSVTAAPSVTVAPLANVVPLVDVVAPDTVGPEAGSGNVLVGYGTGTGAAARRRHRLPGTEAAATPPPRPASAAAVSGAGLVISPLVRRVARDAGIDVTGLRGTGPGGMVRRADVRDAIAAAEGGPVAADEVVIGLHGVRRAIAEKVSRSRREIPEVTIWVDVDATELLETRTAMKAAYPGQPIGPLALLARICVHGLRRFPALNSRVDMRRQEIVQSNRIHLGIATSTDRGLLVPVIPDAQRLTTMELAARLAETTAAARSGTLAPTALTGGTFTLNNYGVFGVDGSTPIINHPEAALLGIGRIVDKPWVVRGQLVVRKVGQISLTFDHRVCDGEVAGGFLRHVADRIEQPALLVAEM
jgi:2-oxoisovalerate dehydrogenase E2 component (dihydrolipoyl transacylase)